MGANHKRGATIDKMAHRLFFAGGFGMHVDDDGITAAAQRAYRQFALHRVEWAIKRIHIDPTHRIDDHHQLAFGRLDHGCTAPWRALGQIGGAQQTRFALDKHKRFTLVEGMVAERHHIRTRTENFRADALGDAKTAGSILAIDDDAIERPSRPQIGQMVDHGLTARLADHITQKQQTHRHYPRLTDPESRPAGISNCSASLIALGEHKVKRLIMIINWHFGHELAFVSQPNSDRTCCTKPRQHPVVESCAITEPLALPVKRHQRNQYKSGDDHRRILGWLIGVEAPRNEGVTCKVAVKPQALTRNCRQSKREAGLFQSQHGKARIDLTTDRPIACHNGFWAMGKF